MAARINVTPQSFFNHSVVPLVQNCGFHWDQKRDIPRSRTGAPDASVTLFPTTFKKPCFFTTDVSSIETDVVNELEAVVEMVEAVVETVLGTSSGKKTLNETTPQYWQRLSNIEGRAYRVSVMFPFNIIQLSQPASESPWWVPAIEPERQEKGMTWKSARDELKKPEPFARKKIQKGTS